MNNLKQIIVKKINDKSFEDLNFYHCVKSYSLRGNDLIEDVEQFLSEQLNKIAIPHEELNYIKTLILDYISKYSYDFDLEIFFNVIHVVERDTYFTVNVFPIKTWRPKRNLDHIIEIFNKLENDYSGKGENKIKNSLFFLKREFIPEFKKLITNRLNLVADQIVNNELEMLREKYKP